MHSVLLLVAVIAGGVALTGPLTRAMGVSKMERPATRSDDAPLTTRYEGCLVLEVRTGEHPVVALLPTRVIHPFNKVDEKTEVKIHHESLFGGNTDGMAAVLRSAESTGTRVDVVVTRFSNDPTSEVFRVVQVNVTGADAVVELIDTVPYASLIMER